jgi:hypothetical protein
MFFSSGCPEEPKQEGPVLPVCTSSDAVCTKTDGQRAHQSGKGFESHQTVACTC